jgi:hypothetical protein
MSDSRTGRESYGYRPAGVRAWLATVALVLFVLMGALVVATELVEHLVMPDWEEQLEQGSIGALALAAATALCAFASIAAAIAAAAAFLSWLYLVAQNARVVAARPPTTSPRMAVACWFIPFLYLFEPYRVVRALYNASSPEAQVAGDWLRRAPAILPVWWATWLISNVAEQISFRLALSDDPSSGRASMWLNLASLPVSAIAAVCAIAVIWSIQARQEALAHASESRTACDEGKG